MLGSLTFSSFLTADQSPLSKLTPSTMKRDEVPHHNKAVVTDNSPETPATVSGNETDLNSPEKKRHE